MRCKPLLLILAMLSASLSLRAADAPSTQPAPPPIAITKTLADLQKQPLLQAPAGVHIRLGLEAKTSPSSSGVLLYCQWDGQGKPISPFRDNDDPLLGPVRIHVERIPEPGEPLLIKEQIKAADASPDAGPGVFITAVKLPRPGKFRITVYGRDNTPLARDLITAANPPAPEWRPWQLAGNPVQRPAHNVPILGVTIAGIPAAPRWKSVRLWNALKPDDPLPTFWPAQESPDLQLTLDNGVVTLVSQIALTPDSEENFLIRWWVNGQPVEFPGRSKLLDAARRVLDLEKPPVTLHWRITVTPDQLAAKPGDKIAIQVIYSAAGSEYMPRGDTTQLMQALTEQVNSPDPPVLLSNKISWTLAAPLDKQPPATAPQ